MATGASFIGIDWMSLVGKLVRQYPAAFEFTGHYLERLVEGLYSAGFITFSGELGGGDNSFRHGSKNQLGMKDRARHWA